MSSTDMQVGELRIDEVGRATIAFGAHLLQSAFSPIYRVDGHKLRPWAFSAAAVVTDRFGVVIEDGPGAELAQRPAGSMHHANLMHRDGDDLAFLEHWDGPADEAFTALGDLVLAAGMAEIAADRLIWEVDLDLALAAGSALEHASRLCVSVCLRLGCDQAASLSAYPNDAPADLVRLIPDGDFREAGRAALLHMTVAHFKARDSAVLVGGIGTPEGLAAALDAGATHVEGPVFGPPVLAGRRAGWHSIDARALTAGSSTVVALR